MMRRRHARRVPILVLLLSLGRIGQVAASPDDIGKRSREILHQALEDKNPGTRKHAVLALSLLGTEYLASLKGMLHDADVDVRLAAVDSISDVTGRQAVEALREALDNDVPEVRYAAAKALWSARDPAGTEALLSILEGDAKTSSSFVSKRKRDALRTVRSRRALLLLAVQRGVGYAPVPYLGLGVTSLRKLFDDPSVSERATVALMLAHARDQASLDALREALTDRDWSVRAAAAHALTLRRASGLKTALAPLLDDENQAVRLRAAAGYLAAARPSRGKPKAEGLNGSWRLR
jgi:HEAT repeat protein